MLAVVKDRPGPGWVLKEVPEPQPRAGEVVVEVKSAGICGTDIPIFSGERAVPIPLIPGHEFSGVVAALGEGVTTLSVGDRVAVRLVIDCRECVYCRRGKESLCNNLTEIGIHVDGGFARYVAVPARNAHRLPDGMSFDEGASLDPIASAYRPVKKAHIKSRDVVAIIGPGPIGLYALQLAKVEGARRVIVLGTRNNRLQVARELGADDVINVRETDPVDALRDLTRGMLADIVVEATGSPEAIEMALACTGKGGKVMLAGIFHDAGRFMPSPVVRNELTIKGSFCYTWQDFEHCLSLVADGRVRTDPVITHHFPLEQFAAGLEAIHSREAIKVMIHPN